MKKNKSINDQEKVAKFQSFLTDSANDYIAARVLFLSNLPKQAAILSSTSIEKCFKALLAINGNESHGHLQKAHWNAVKKFDKKLYSSLNEEFIKLNKKVYSLRYTDNLPPNFNLVIASREFLAELDQTILTISRCFQFGGKDESYRLFTTLEQFVNSKDDRVCADNHVLSGLPKEQFIYQSPQFVYEIRNPVGQHLFEATYTSNKKPKDSSFLRAGITPKGDNKTYELGFFPMKNEQD